MNIDLKKTIAAATLLTLLPIAPLAIAAGKRPTPPQAAVDACKNMKAGDKVEYTTPKGNTVRAICRDVDGKLVALVSSKSKGGKK